MKADPLKMLTLCACKRPPSACSFQVQVGLSLRYLPCHHHDPGSSRLAGFACACLRQACRSQALELGPASHPIPMRVRIHQWNRPARCAQGQAVRTFQARVRHCRKMWISLCQGWCVPGRCTNLHWRVCTCQGQDCWQERHQKMTCLVGRRSCMLEQ